MGNSRSWTTKHNARNEELRAALKRAGITTAKKRREKIAVAASGRPSDLSDKAKLSLAIRRAAGKGA